MAVSATFLLSIQYVLPLHFTHHLVGFFYYVSRVRVHNDSCRVMIVNCMCMCEPLQLRSMM